MSRPTARLLAASALVVAAAACTTEVVTRQEPAPTTESQPTTPQLQPIAGNVTIDKVSLYQSVEVRLLTDGAPAPKRNSPIVTKRPALVRVHATKEPIIRVGKVTAKLHVTIDGEEKVLEDGPKPIAAFDDASLDSTFNFALEAAEMTADMQMSVELIGSDPADKVSGAELEVGAEDAAKLRVQLIPIRYQADGSDRMADLGAANIKRYHDALYQVYPVSEVEVTMHAPLGWDVPIDPTGEGWNQLLGAVMDMRATEDVDEDVYYMGVFNPAANLREYCGRGGCILGVAPASGINPQLDTDMSLRSALVVGYQTDKSGSTFAQELAHAMGRMHAPCGNPAAIDPKYPYKVGGIGTSGWDPLSGEIVSADGHADFMSYCDPSWVSDYTYEAIFDRMAKVSSIMAQGQRGGSDDKRVARSGPAPFDARKAESSRGRPLERDELVWTFQR